MIVRLLFRVPVRVSVRRHTYKNVWGSQTFLLSYEGGDSELFNYLISL